MKALFDTNILIDYLAGVRAAEKELGRYSHRFISAITWMEVMVGAQGEEEEDVIDLFLRDFKIIEVGRSVARAAIEIRREHRVRLLDSIIWASARQESALLVTRNTKDFPKKDPGVRVPY